MEACLPPGPPRPSEHSGKIRETAHKTEHAVRCVRCSRLPHTLCPTASHDGGIFTAQAHPPTVAMQREAVPISWVSTPYGESIWAFLGAFLVPLIQLLISHALILQTWVCRNYPQLTVHKAPQFGGPLLRVSRTDPPPPPRTPPVCVQQLHQLVMSLLFTPF